MDQGGFDASVLFVPPLAAKGAALDAIGSQRSLAVFLHATAAGSTVGLLALVATLGTLLPLAFRWTLPLRTTLPDQAAADVLSTVARLGFSPRRVLALRTSHRVVNAALVGPLAWPRYLMLTDGILAVV